MDYSVLHVPARDDEEAELLIAALADLPFESFETGEGELAAYLPTSKLAGCRAAIDAVLAGCGATGRYEAIPTQNWNAVWEADYPAVDVEGRLRIRAPFHAPAPTGGMEVVLHAGMSFGTGHHATTWLMARAVLGLELAECDVLDLGSGTGVLAIVAAKCGARHADAVDIDDCAVRSCRENAVQNGVEGCVAAIQGDASWIEGHRYDCILANINRNILLDAMPRCAAALRPGGRLLMSGFLREDVAAITACAARHGLETEAVEEREGWMMVRTLRRA